MQPSRTTAHASTRLAFCHVSLLRRNLPDSGSSSSSLAWMCRLCTALRFGNRTIWASACGNWHVTCVSPCSSDGSGLQLHSGVCTGVRRRDGHNVPKRLRGRLPGRGQHNSRRLRRGPAPCGGVSEAAGCAISSVAGRAATCHAAAGPRWDSVQASGPFATAAPLQLRLYAWPSAQLNLLSQHCHSAVSSKWQCSLGVDASL